MLSFLASLFSRAAPAPQFGRPAVKDILLCRFPDDDSGRPGQKPRPVIVQELDGDWLVVAYGTSRRLDDVRQSEFVVYPDPKNGLDRATKFSLSRQYRLPMTWEFFQVPRGRPFGKSPKMGALTGLDRLSRFWAGL